MNYNDYLTLKDIAFRYDNIKYLDLYTLKLLCKRYGIDKIDDILELILREEVFI